MVVVVAVAEGVDLNLLRTKRCRDRTPWLSDGLAREPWWSIACGPAPYEPSNLATALTGKGRGHHGCYSYWRIRSDDGGAPPVLTSDDVLVSWLWNWPELAGLRIAVVNVQLTHPPRPLNGILLSYLMEQTLQYSYPAGFVHQLKRQGLRYGHDVSVFHRGEPAEAYFHNILKVARYQLETALEIGREHDLLIVNLTIVDRLSHFLWHELEATPTTEDPAILRGYAFVDEALTKLDMLADSEPMLVMSEIGFGPLDRFESLDDVLARGGFLKRAPDGEIVTPGTRAREAVQGSHGIVLCGADETGKTLRDEVMQCLREARANDGKHVVGSAVPREALYDGPAVSRAPDIVVTPADPARPPAGDPRWARRVHRHLQTGWHRDGGFAMVRRARRAAVSTVASLENIAPTVAALVGRSAPAGFAPALAYR